MSDQHVTVNQAVDRNASNAAILRMHECFALAVKAVLLYFARVGAHCGERVDRQIRLCRLAIDVRVPLPIRHTAAKTLILVLNDSEIFVGKLGRQELLHNQRNFVIFQEGGRKRNDFVVIAVTVL